jgi:hypothetical protein
MKYDKIPKLKKRKWLKALRSGEYQQGRGKLYESENVMCCIGVGAAVLDNDVSRNNTFDCAEIIGLDEEARERLVEMNDKKNWSFERIATWIEKHL